MFGTTRRHDRRPRPGRAGISWPPGAAAGLLALSLWAAGAGPAGLRAQAVESVDDGTFQLRIRARAIGTEAFAVRREGDVIKAVGRVRVDSTAGAFTPLEVWMQTDRSYRPALFRLRPARGRVDLVAAVRQADRIRLQVSTDRGDRNREFVAPEHVTVMEPHVAHHYFLLLRQHRDRLQRGSTYTGTVLIPSRAEQAGLSLRWLTEPPAGADAPAGAQQAYEISVAGSSVRAWTDGRGRLLRVGAADGSWAAVRLDGKGP